MSQVDYEYVTIDVDLMVHPKALAAGIEAMGLWLWGMAWSHKTGANGKIPRHVVAMAFGGPPAVVTKLAKRLVSSGLWLATDDGWTIWNYGKKNQSAEEKERRREQGRERMRKLREKSRDAACDAQCDASRARNVRDQSDAPASVPVTALSESRSPEPDPARATPANDNAPATWSTGAPGMAARERFEHAVATATGKPFALDRAFWHQQNLCDLLTAHAKGLAKAPALDWLENTVGEWVAAEGTTADGWEPKGLLRWLNAGRSPRSQTGKRGRGGGPRGDRQGLDGWTPPKLTGTDDDHPFGSES